MNAPSPLRQATAAGRRIENDSFAIVDREAGPHAFSPEEWEVVRRVIHATADFEFKELVAIGHDAVRAGAEALKRGAPIVVDVKMIAVGLNAKRLARFGCSTHGFVSDEDVIARAKAEGTTRSAIAMRKAYERGLLGGPPADGTPGGIVAVGNAPTALLELVRLVREEGARPAVVIGMPVGFVNAAESKEALEALGAETGLPTIVTRGRKGGSTCVVAAIHALMHVALGDLR